MKIVQEDIVCASRLLVDRLYEVVKFLAWNMVRNIRCLESSSRFAR